MVRSVSWKTEALSDWASWKRYLHPWSRTMVRRVGKSPSRGPDTSKDVFNTPSARSLVESVCMRSCGSRIFTRTLSSSTIDGSPSEISHQSQGKQLVGCYNIQSDFGISEASCGLTWPAVTESPDASSMGRVGEEGSVPAGG